MSSLEIDPQSTGGRSGRTPDGDEGCRRAPHPRRDVVPAQSLGERDQVERTGALALDEDLLSSLERLERAARRPLIEDDEPEGPRRTRPYGRHGGGRERTQTSAGGVEQRVRGPRFEW